MLTNLIPDIYALLQRKDGWFDDRVQRNLSEGVSKRIQKSFEKQETKATLRLSRLGPSCPRALWYSIHRPDLAEPLPSPAIFKYAYGHLIEALAIELAKEAGHIVEGEQDEIIVDDIVGHRDVVIDGCVVDVKSCSSLAFNKYKAGSLAQDDPFGYLEQIDGYVVGSLNDPIVKIKDRGWIWAIDKTLGKMVLYEHRIREDHLRERIQKYKGIVALSNPPPCQCGTRSSGKSGNVELDVKASYSPYKHICFPRLRIFLYADGPKFFSHVERVPDVPEVYH